MFENQEQHNIPEQEGGAEDRRQHLEVQMEYLSDAVAYMKTADPEEVRRVFLAIYGDINSENTEEKGVDLGSKYAMIEKVESDIKRARKEYNELS